MQMKHTQGKNANINGFASISFLITYVSLRERACTWSGWNGGNGAQDQVTLWPPDSAISFPKIH